MLEHIVREVLNALLLQVFKDRWDGTLSNLI